MHNQQIIETQNLTFKYLDAPEPALRSLNFEVEKGSFVAVLGANGSGKSTLAKHFNAILLPAGGTVYVAGLNTKEEGNLLPIRQKVGMVFQNPDNQIVATTVEEDVAFGLENLGVEPQEMRRRIDGAMAQVGIGHLAGVGPHKLSGGQKQRVAIAGIVAMRPDVILLDEATAMLDPAGRTQVMETVKDLNKTFGITVIHITHYMEEATVADRVVVMSKGEIVLDGTPKEVFKNPEEVKAYGLDVPDATELTARLKTEGWTLPDGIITADECAGAIFNYLSGVLNNG